MNRDRSVHVFTTSHCNGFLPLDCKSGPIVLLFWVYTTWSLNRDARDHDMRYGNTMSLSVHSINPGLTGESEMSDALTISQFLMTIKVISGRRAMRLTVSKTMSVRHGHPRVQAYATV